MGENGKSEYEGVVLFTFILIFLGFIGKVVLNVWENLTEKLGFSDKSLQTVDLFGWFNHLFGWGVFILLIGLFVYIGLKVLQIWLSRDIVTIGIYPKHDLKVDVKRVQKMVETLHTLRWAWFKRPFLGRIWVSWLVMKNEEGQVSFKTVCPRRLKRFVEKAILNGFPGCEVVEEENIYFGEVKKGGHFKFDSWQKAYGLKTKVENQIGDVIIQMPKGSWMDVRLSPSMNKMIEKASHKRLNWLSKKSKKATETHDNKELSIDQKYIIERYKNRQIFDVSISVFSNSKEVIPVGNSLRAVTKDLNALQLKLYRLKTDVRSLYRFPMLIPLIWRRIQLVDVELSNIMLIPDQNEKSFEYVIKLDEGVKMLKTDQFSSGIKVGTSKHPKQPRDIKVKYDHLRYHGFIVGATGQGKGAVLGEIYRSFCKDWIKDEHAPGLTIFDPHRNSGLLLLNSLIDLEKQGEKVDWSKVHYFWFGDSEYPISMNLLNKNPGDNLENTTTRVTSNICSSFGGELTKSWTVLENIVRTLLLDNRPRTIADIVNLLRDEKDFHRLMGIVKEKNPNLFTWWQMERKQPSKLDAVVTRLNPFLMNQTLQRMYCQERSSLDVKKFLDEGHIIICDFKEAPLETLKLTSSYVVDSYRSEMHRRDGLGRIHGILVDEAQLFEVESFRKILQEDRKFGLGLWSITQDVTGLSKELCKGLMVNGHTYISLNPGKGSGSVAEIMNNTVSSKYLDSLKPLNGICYSKLEQAKVSISIEPPAFIWDGQVTSEGSEKEGEAMAEAWKRAKDLQEVDGKHYSEVDDELYFRATGQKRRRGLKVHV